MSLAAAGLEEAAAALEAGRVVAVPTDTVYGLAALARSKEACEAIFVLKRRPDGLALPVLVGSHEAALELAARPVRPALSLVAEALWPGPLTLVVEAAPPRPAHLGGEGASVGLRFPDEDLVAALCARVGPIAVTSANRHGEPPCTTAAAVRAAFPEGLGAVLDGGERSGTPSSVVSLLGPEPELLRAGPVALEAVVEALAPLREGRGPK